MTKQEKTTNKWVCCWGYDQTQYSIYEEVSRKGCFVVVRALDWGCLHDGDLYDGSKVKIYETIPDFHNIPEFEREIIAKKLNWDMASVKDFFTWDRSREWELRERREKAPIRTIVKVTHEKNNEGRRYWVWELDNGEIVKGIDLYRTFLVDIVDALTRRKIRKTDYFGEEEESIKINESIRAHLDKDYDKYAQKYADQNEYTFYNGR